ncbi:MAG: glucose-1-phosphate thymidylyltransferase RfbA [Oscillospiraceae bacterium]
MKGIILAAGKGTRLYPMTYPVCKPLLPIYDKPMIYYPLDVLLQAGIRDILIITPPHGEIEAFRRLLGDGGTLGARISYMEQPVARGIADALILGERFIDGDRVCLVLGDNIFFSPHFGESLSQAIAHEEGATIFGYYVDDPRPFGVVEFDAQGNVLSLEEKPKQPKSNYIVPGLYFYDSQASGIAGGLTPSARGELEITDVNIEYMRRGQLKVALLDREFTWFDAGTADSLLAAATGIKRLQAESGRYIGCIEETAWRKGFITKEQKDAVGAEMRTTLYGQYLLSL